MRIHTVSCATDSSGDVVAFSPKSVLGRVVRVFIDIGTLTTADFTVIGEKTSEAIYSDTGINADTLVVPTTSTGVYVWDERIKVTVANGGDTKTGTISFLVDDTAP